MMRSILRSFLAAAMLAAAVPAMAAMRLGVVAPGGDDSFAMLGDQLRRGIDVYQQSAGQPFAAIVTAPETCEAESGAAAAKAMVDSKVDVAVGFLCAESLTAALPILSKAGIATLVTGVRADVVMEEAVKRNWPAYRLAPGTSDEIGRIAGVIEKQWADDPFALVEDGTIYGRNLVENVRVELESKGLSAAFVDTYRPAQDKQFGLAHRLERSGATHVLIGGDRSDIAVIARDCAALGLDLTIMGGDSLRAAPGDVALRDGVIGVMTPEPASLPSASEAVAAFKTQGVATDGDHLVGYAAAQLADQAARSAREKGITLAGALAAGTFHTALGDIRFTEAHERADNPFEPMLWNGRRFVPSSPEGTGTVR